MERYLNQRKEAVCDDGVQGLADEERTGQRQHHQSYASHKHIGHLGNLFIAEIATCSNANINTQKHKKCQKLITSMGLMWQPSGLLRAAHLPKIAAYAMEKASD